MSAIEPVKRRDPSTPVPQGMAVRVAILSAVAIALFSVIFFRLWYLQVLSGEQYVRQADANRVRDLPIPAPRGQLLDREGKPIVTSVTTNAVQIVPSALPPPGAPRIHLYRKLGRLLGMSAAHIEAIVVHERTEVPYAPVTIKTDAGPGALTVLAERQNEYPGVVQQPVSIRSYPYGEMAAQVIGHTGQVNGEELKMKAFRGVEQGEIVGQEGLEYYYDRYLRGKPGIRRVEVNSLGLPVSARIAPTPPVAGHSLKLTLDLGLQREAEKALTEAEERARANGKPATAGAFVAMDPRNGQILAIGSQPSFNPNDFAKPLTYSELHRLEGNSSTGGPLTDRAVDGQYPTGSTFKPITAMAALEAGVISPDEGLGAGSCIFVSTEEFCNAGKADFGAVGLVEALKVSSDTYFFEVGKRANAHGNVIQEKARQLGIGEKTGIDLPEEFEGVIPDKRWRERENKLELACERQRHVSNCGIVEEPTGTWTVGDNMHLAVGQGELLTDPLQMAVAYSTLANAYNGGGTGAEPTPHLGMEIDEDNTGAEVQRLSFPPKRVVHLDYSDLSLVMEGIHEAASQPGGTSAEVWAGWNQAAHPVYGKTGTAQHTGREDQSWYMCYLGDPSRPIVIAVTVEEGGFGAETAAPVARLMASQWFGVKGKFVAGSSKTY
jgi:penicillin-binding protein 2